MSNHRQFIKDVRKTAKEAGITIKRVNADKIYTDDSKDPYLGYFDSVDMELAVSVKRSKSSYYSILAHESSHMDQFIQNKYLWDKHEPGYTIFFGWLNEEEEIEYRILEEAVQDVIRVELDAERRTVEKIKKYHLPVDIPFYIQGVNAYMHRFLFALETKRWVPEYPSLVEKCSTKFKKSYIKIPRRVYRELVRLNKVEEFVY